MTDIAEDSHGSAACIDLNLHTLSFAPEVEGGIVNVVICISQGDFVNLLWNSARDKVRSQEDEKKRRKEDC